MKHVMHVRCGCGASGKLKTLTAEKNCDNCKWPIVYSLGCGAFALSSHISLTLLPAPKRSAAK